MSDIPITECHQRWLEHIQAAEAFDGSIGDYARSEGLKPKELYFWRGILARRGSLKGLAGAALAANSGAFGPARGVGGPAGDRVRRS
jgi:hypothetical protein